MLSANYKRLTLITTCSLVVLSTLSASTNMAIATQPPEDLEKVALKLVAKRIGLPISESMVVGSAMAENPQDEAVLGSTLVDNRNQTVYLAVTNSTKAEYPIQGKSVYEFKVIDNRNGAIYGITLDENGQELDSAKLALDEQAAYAARYGKLEPALAELLTGLSGNEPIEVIIWLKEPPYVSPERPAPNTPPVVSLLYLPSVTNASGYAYENPISIASQQVEEEQQASKPDKDDIALRMQEQQRAFFAQFSAQVDAARAKAVEAVTAPVVDKLAKLSYKVETDPYAPVLYTSLPPSVIQEVAKWGEVDKIYLPPTDIQPELDVARVTIGANAVNARGFTGSGVRVALIEPGGRVAIGNPFLSGITQDSTFVCLLPQSHATAVAGIIRSTHSRHRGIAPGVSLWVGGSCSSGNRLINELHNRSNAAADWGARVINLSWGVRHQNDHRNPLVPGMNDRFYDNMVINRNITIVKSAGNRACGGDGNVTSPGLAYNIITVGNFDDRNTVRWDDDVMNPCSSWRDPESWRKDREKPEVAAPGTNINTTTILPPWRGNAGSGTSFAAPMVTGVAALLIQRNSNLAVWPEAIKAIIMATAVNNIEGRRRLSEYDGAGGIVANRADDVVRGVSGTWGGRSYSCGTVDPLDVATMYLYGGMRTRAVIAWNTDPSYQHYANQPSADLDLQIVSPSGGVVASSYSWDNTYEIVDFTPSISGNYKLRVKRFRCDLSPRWLGWAWRRGD